MDTVKKYHTRNIACLDCRVCPPWCCAIFNSVRTVKSGLSRSESSASGLLLGEKLNCIDESNVEQEKSLNKILFGKYLVRCL
jgi:hypothetical protein